MTVRLSSASKPYVKALSFGTIRDKVEVQIRRGLYIAGRENVRDTRLQMTNEPKTGRDYIYRGRRYRASASGEAPAVRSGNLHRSVDYKVTGGSSMAFGDGAFYGKFLENGTRKMAPRPHLSKTVKKRAGVNARLILNHDVRKLVK